MSIRRDQTNKKSGGVLLPLIPCVIWFAFLLGGGLHKLFWGALCILCNSAFYPEADSKTDCCSQHKAPCKDANGIIPLDIFLRCAADDILPRIVYIVGNGHNLSHLPDGFAGMLILVEKGHFSGCDTYLIPIFGRIISFFQIITNRCAFENLSLTNTSKVMNFRPTRGPADAEGNPQHKQDNTQRPYG